MQKTFNEIPFEGYFIPFSAHISQSTVISKSGLISQTIKLEPSSSVSFKDDIIKEIQSILTYNILVNIHTIYSKQEEEGRMSFTEYLKTKQMQNIFLHNQCTHEFYITISIIGYKINKNSAGHFLLQNKFLMELEKSIKNLEEIVKKFCTGIKQYSPTLLTAENHGEFLYSQNAAFLYHLLFGVHTQIPLADTEISEYIKPTSIRHHKNYLTIKRGKLQNFTTCLTVKDFPYVDKSKLVKIFTSKCPFIISQTIHAVDAKEIKGLFEYQHKTSNVLRNNDISKICSWEEILNERRPVIMQTNFIIHAETMQEMQSATNEIMENLHESGIVATREDINLEQVFYASLPANPSFLNRIEYTNIKHAGQQLFSKNVLFAGVDKIQHLPFLPLVSTNNAYYALSPFRTQKTHHVLIHGLQNPNQTIFINTLLLHLVSKSKVVCVDTHYSSLALNKICHGRYASNVQVNILNLLKYRRKHFFVFFSYLSSYYCTLHSISNNEELSQAIRDFCLKLKHEMTFEQILQLTTNKILIEILNFANNNGFFALDDIFEDEHLFVSINTNNLEAGLYTLFALYTLFVNVHHIAPHGIIKFDRTFEIFNEKILPQEILSELLKEYKERFVCIIACSEIPETFEKHHIVRYGEVFSHFAISIFMESECSTHFIKQFFQLNSKISKQLMFVKEGTNKVVVNTPEDTFTIKLKDALPLSILKVFNQRDEHYKTILKIIEINKQNAQSLVKEYKSIL